MFRPALARYCSAMCDVSAEGWPLGKMFDQLGRYINCYMLIYSYYEWRDHGGPPPTLAALQKLVPSSQRQTASFVSALKAGRFVTVEEDPADRRNKLLRPGHALIQEIGRSPRLFLRARAEIEESVELREPSADGEEWLGRLVHRSAAYVIANGTLLHGFPAVLHFAQRDCGYPLLTAIMANHYARTHPGSGAAPPIGRRALAERFQVSVAHVGNLLSEGAARGWLIRMDPGCGWAATPGFVDEFEHWASLQMVHVTRLLASVRSVGAGASAAAP